jgi:hypothetical protein
MAHFILTTAAVQLVAVMALQLLGIIVIIGMLGLFALLCLFLVYLYLGRKVNAQLDSDFKTKPGQTLAQPMTVTYHVDVTYTQKGVPKTTPLKGAEVTFSLERGDANVDGAMSKVVSTDANGDASVVLSPVRNGHDTLKVHVKAGSKEGDESPLNFETVHH